MQLASSRLCSAPKASCRMPGPGEQRRAPTEAGMGGCLGAGSGLISELSHLLDGVRWAATDT